jgi:hypothetical protein
VITVIHLAQGIKQAMMQSILHSLMLPDNKAASISPAASEYHIHVSDTYFQTVLDTESTSTRIIFQMQINLQRSPQEFINESIIFTRKDLDEGSDLTHIPYGKNGKNGVLQPSSQQPEVRRMSRLLLIMETGTTVVYLLLLFIAWNNRDYHILLEDTHTAYHLQLHNRTDHSQYRLSTA